MLPLVSIWLAKILCCIINGEPSWYSANQWENLRRWRNIWFAASYPSLSYADSVNFKAFLLWYWSTKWVCFPNCILIYSITSWVYKEYPSFSKVLKKKKKRSWAEGQNNSKKKSIFYDFECQFISMENAILGHKGPLSSAITSVFNVYKTQKTTKCMIQMKG